MHSKATVEILVITIGNLKRRLRKHFFFFLFLSMVQLAVVLTMLANPYEVTKHIIGRKTTLQTLQNNSLVSFWSTLSYSSKLSK